MTDAAHPCFSCTLPDCDDSDKRCQLRRAMSKYKFLQRRKQPIADEIKKAKAIAYEELHGHLRERYLVRSKSLPHSQDETP